MNRRARQREPSQKRLIASQLKPRKGKDIKWILIENILILNCYLNLYNLI